MQHQAIGVIYTTHALKP